MVTADRYQRRNSDKCKENVCFYEKRQKIAPKTQEGCRQAPGVYLFNWMDRCIISASQFLGFFHHQRARRRVQKSCGACCAPNAINFSKNICFLAMVSKSRLWSEQHEAVLFFCAEIRGFNFQLKGCTQTQEKRSGTALWVWLRVWWGITLQRQHCVRAACWASLDVTLELNSAPWSRTLASFHLKLLIFHSSPHLLYFLACNAQGISRFRGASSVVHKYFSCLKAGSELGQIAIHNLTRHQFLCWVLTGESGKDKKKKSLKNGFLLKWWVGFPVLFSTSWHSHSIHHIKWRGECMFQLQISCRTLILGGSLLCISHSSFLHTLT